MRPRFAGLTFSVAATGTAPLSYQWLKNGAIIPGATSASYSIGAVQTADAASYTVRVSNAAGTVASSAAILSVMAPLQFPFTSTFCTSTIPRLGPVKAVVKPLEKNNRMPVVTVLSICIAGLV